MANAGQQDDLPRQNAAAVYPTGHVPVRLTEFTPDDPAVWFALTERTFSAARITDEDTKFSLALNALSRNHITTVRDILLRPPENPYMKLKEELVKRLSSTQEENTRQLLERETIGGRKPSEFLRALRALGGDAFGDGPIKTIWSSRLPQYARMILASQQDMELEKLADLADSIVSVSKEFTPSISEVSRESTPYDASVNARFLRLELNMEDMMKEISSLRQSDRNSRSRSRARSSSRPRSNSSSNNGHCWYHRKYGADAKKCVGSCNFSGNASGNR